jgi:NAD(P)-dependent dehydrogenase (short-subunit alcohol dehydrogenase family)
MRLNGGKTCIVTAAASGIGKTIASAFAKEGAKLVHCRPQSKCCAIRAGAIKVTVG